MLHIEPVKAFKDNYLWTLHHSGGNQAVVVDPGDAVPVRAWLKETGLQLTAILITHHHADHIGGVSELYDEWQVPVYGPDSARIPQVTHVVRDGDTVAVLGLKLRVLSVPGHTLEHIAYYAAETDGTPLVFCGDTLFAAGCGRMFEGTPPMMYASLQKLAELPASTRVYCTHEYTLSNLKFAQAVLGDAVADRIGHEQRKREDPVVLAALACKQQVATLEPAQVFGALRRWKDGF